MRHKIRPTNDWHGMSKHPAYHCWVDMMNRCYNPHRQHFEHYGGRGIVLCEEWQRFPAFAEWADSSGHKPGLSIERVDVDGNYEPANCKWITKADQQRNKRSSRHVHYRGQRMTATEAARAAGLQPSTVSYRLRRGWPEDAALAAPPDCGRRGPPRRT